MLLKGRWPRAIFYDSKTTLFDWSWLVAAVSRINFLIPGSRRDGKLWGPCAKNREELHEFAGSDSHGSIYAVCANCRWISPEEFSSCMITVRRRALT